VFTINEQDVKVHCCFQNGLRILTRDASGTFTGGLRAEGKRSLFPGEILSLTDSKNNPAF
jgi:hypothetical protein